MTEEPWRCLWPACTHPPFPVMSMAYHHMLTCPHRPQEPS